MCLSPCQGVPHLLLIKPESFGAAEKPSITGGAMCAVPLEAQVPVVTCAHLTLLKPGTGLMLHTDIIQPKVLALGTSAVMKSGQDSVKGVKVPFSLNSSGP